MTLKGQNNHYNIKFLKGYGFSISVKNSHIVLKNRPDPFKGSEIEEHIISKLPYEKIILSGNGLEKGSPERLSESASSFQGTSLGTCI